MTFNLTTFPDWRDKWMQRVVREIQAAGPVSYTTGGDPIQAATLGLGTVYGVYGSISNGTAVLVGNFDFTNQTLRWFVPSTGAEVANAVDLSTYTGTLLITGKD